MFPFFSAEILKHYLTLYEIQGGLRNRCVKGYDGD